MLIYIVVVHVSTWTKPRLGIRYFFSPVLRVQGTYTFFHIHLTHSAQRSKTSCRRPISHSPVRMWACPSPNSRDLCTMQQLAALIHMPGYTLSRSPKSVHMEINTDVFFGTTTGGHVSLLFSLQSTHYPPPPPAQTTRRVETTPKPTEDPIASPHQKAPVVDERVSEERF